MGSETADAISPSASAGLVLRTAMNRFSGRKLANSVVSRIAME
jgi:hypothetical protein